MAFFNNNKNQTQTAAAVAVSTPTPSATTPTTSTPTEDRTRISPAVAVHNIKTAVEAGTLLCSEQTGEDGRKYNVFRTAKPEDMKAIAYNLTYLNGEWNRDDWSCYLPVEVLTDPAAAEAAHEARAAKLADRKTRRAVKTATKAASATGERMFTTAEVRALLKTVNSQLTDAVIDILLKNKVA